MVMQGTIITSALDSPEPPPSIPLTVRTLNIAADAAPWWALKWLMAVGVKCTATSAVAAAATAAAVAAIAAAAAVAVAAAAAADVVFQILYLLCKFLESWDLSQLSMRDTTTYSQLYYEDIDKFMIIINSVFSKVTGLVFVMQQVGY